LFWGTVTLTTPGLAIGLGRLNELFSFASLKAAPARLAILDRFFLCREILTAPLFAFLQRTREDLSVETAPALWRTLFLVRERFVLCRVALAAFRQAIRPGGLKNFSVNAAPPTWLAISDRVLFGPKALTTFLPAILSVGAENLSVHTAPMTRLTTFDRVFGARVTLPTSRLAIGSRANVNYTIDTAVAPLGRKACVIAAAAVGTWQRPPEAVRRIRRRG
jgi:hypothetical protein